MAILKKIIFPNSVIFITFVLNKNK